MKRIVLLPFYVLLGLVSFAQEDTVVPPTEDVPLVEEPEDLFIHKTYNSTRIINGHSIETLDKGVLEFRIEHRFGDIAGSNGGVQNWYGLDNAADIRFAFEYGISDRLMVGLGRSKGTGAPYRSLVDGFIKYRLLRQQTHGMPVSVTVAGIATGTYMKASPDVSQVSHFPEWQHRLAYASEVNIARKFGTRLSLSVIPTLVYRNYVAAGDLNALFALGGAAKFNITPKKAIIVEYYQTFAGEGYRSGFRNSFGVAYEWDTFGHNFTINFTNSRGFVETQFIPYTTENWLKGQFRFGFSIARKFSKG